MYHLKLGEGLFNHKLWDPMLNLRIQASRGNLCKSLWWCIDSGRKKNLAEAKFECQSLFLYKKDQNPFQLQFICSQTIVPVPSESQKVLEWSILLTIGDKTIEVKNKLFRDCWKVKTQQKIFNFQICHFKMVVLFVLLSFLCIVFK